MDPNLLDVGRCSYKGNGYAQGAKESPDGR